MRKTLLVFACLFFAAFSYAQSNDYEIGYLCSDNGRDYYRIEAYMEGVWAFVPQGANGQVLYLENPNGVHILNFPSPSIGVLAYYGMMQLGIFYAKDEACNFTPPALPNPEPMNECLGIAPSAYNLPDSGVFVVDNQSYAYADNLSFLVPIDIAWQWDLYVNGEYILSFAQDEDNACHIVGGE